MGKAPKKCPMCGEVKNWKKVDSENKGFSVGKAAVGGILLGPVGLVGGALGKKKSAYYCGKCGFSHEYKG
jgi:tellurium resistance protein TerD